MRTDDAVVPDLHALIDYRVRSYSNGRVELRFRMEDRCRVNHRVKVGHPLAMPSQKLVMLRMNVSRAFCFHWLTAALSQPATPDSGASPGRCRGKTSHRCNRKW